MKKLEIVSEIDSEIDSEIVFESFIGFLSKRATYGGTLRVTPIWSLIINLVLN